MSEKVLITGATGFVGSRLAERLVMSHYDTHATVRNSSHYWRIEHLRNDLQLHMTDLLNAESINQLIAKIKPNIVFHLACYGGFADEINAPQILNTNFTATYHLLNACSQYNVEKFIYIGSSSEYGVHTNAISEQHLERPNSLYGISKLAATHLVRVFAETNKLPTSILRIFSPYGAYDDKRRLIPTVINACLHQQTLKLGNGNHVRDFIYVEDIINAFMSALSHAPTTGEIINLGSGKQHSVAEVVNTIIGISGCSIIPQWNAYPSRPNEPKNWVADIRKAQQLLNWSPTTSLTQGLQDTIEWTKQQIQFSQHA